MIENHILSMTYRLITELAQSTGPENIGPERPLPARLAPGQVNSPAHITLEYKEKIRIHPDQENAFAGQLAERKGLTSNLLQSESRYSTPSELAQMVLHH